MLRSLLALALIYSTAANALAQSSETPATPVQTTSPTLKSASDWPAPNISPKYGHDLQVITLARPGVRQRCNLAAIDAESITCIDRHKKHIFYQKDEIASIIDPRYHFDRNFGILLIGVGAAALGGSFFVPLGWSIALRFITGYELSGAGLFVAGCCVGQGKDHNHDILLYQRPATALTIHLR